ncbi:PREDICTED: uncharacterized protein LOC104820575 [Tarenaya hassleriana]|uniref:uncharacterized protein LOC104820575 n=1 Tax=Tarenaya hassleriana TaxID=28532 RepID=UPI00053C84AE|nr:PREDICTED: uncharacterized protein LOC104820575 [Tarenaya hassleriana]
MASISEEVRAKAEIYHGDAICQEKTKEFLKEVAMPNGLLPLKDIEEVGYDRESGTVWLKQKKSINHKFEKIGKLVSYATEVTAVAETGKIRKLTGVKAKELLVWVTLNEIVAEETKKITFKTPAGLSRSFPYSAFEVPEEKEVATAKEKSSESEGNKAVEVKEV